MSELLVESYVKQEFLTELESILESDEAYGSNIQVLTYSVKDKVINGKFKDSWNNRVYEFIIDIERISYKPAPKLDSFNVDELPARFDSFSEGYRSLFVDVRLDRNPTGKRVKKPKCGKEGYGCGFSCIGLTKTCRILSSGKKTRGEFQGKAIGKERLTKLMALSVKLATSGEEKKFAAVNAVGAKITSAKNKYQEEGRDRLVQRQITNKEKQFAEPTAKAEPTARSEKVSLSNKEFRVANDAEVREKISQWTDSYKKIQKMVNDENYETGLDSKRLEAAADVIGSLIDLSEYGKDYATFGGIIDSKGKLQAVYTCDELPDGYYVDYLASAPWNCLSSHPDKKMGAGASAIESLIKAAINDNKGGEIKLQALPDAVPFYKKIGFEIKKDGKIPYMTLDGRDAKKFIETQDQKNRKDARVDIDYRNLTELEILEENALGLFTVPANFVLTSQKRGKQ